MKTIFEAEEIIEFLRKKKDEIVGEEILSRTSTNFDPDAPVNMSMTDALMRIRDIGLTQGKIEGKIELMNELIVFFEL